MGLAYIEGTVTGPTAIEKSVRFLVDSGVTYTLLPDDVWRAIGLKPVRTIDCVLADGSTIERGVSECRISIPQGTAHTAAPVYR